MSEFDNIKDLDKLVNMATSVSTQLLALDEESGDETELDDEDEEYEISENN